MPSFLCTHLTLSLIPYAPYKSRIVLTATKNSAPYVKHPSKPIYGVWRVFYLYHGSRYCIHGSVRCCRDYYTITSTYSTYKKGSLNWTYQPTNSNHGYSKVDMFPISEQHCPYILYPANSSSTYSTLKQKSAEQHTLLSLWVCCPTENLQFAVF